MQFSVLQWNIWESEPIEHIAAFLKQHPADIICLQELTLDHPRQSTPDTPAFIASRLGMGCHFKPIPINLADGLRYTFANAIFTHFPMSQQHAVLINRPQHGGGYDDEYRVYVETAVDINGARVIVGTVHMSYTDRFVITPNKRAETDRLLTQIRKHRSRYLIAGDFNATPGSYTIESVLEVLANAGPDLAQKTWTTKPFSYRGFASDKLDWRIDHIFATPDLKVISSDILKTDYSDHLPLLTTFEMK